MENQEYLQNLLKNQKLSDNQLKTLREYRDKIQRIIRQELNGNPVFYYGGSYGKKTIIKESYDLDIVVYWPMSTKYKLKEIFNGVKNALIRNDYRVKTKTVAIQIPYPGDFHIDIVPGRALDEKYKYANLYNNKTGTSLKTSLKIHIETVRNSGRRDVIKLMKLWKNRKNLNFKTFIMEQMVLEGVKGTRKNNLEGQLIAAFKYIYNNIGHTRIIDPANSNNVISEELSQNIKNAIRREAKKAIDAKSWSEVFSRK